MNVVCMTEEETRMGHLIVCFMNVHIISNVQIHFVYLCSIFVIMLLTVQKAMMNLSHYVII